MFARRNESPELKELLQLFESCLQLSLDGDGGSTVTPKIFHKAVGGQSLGAAVYNYLSKLSGGDGSIVIDDLMRFVTNMTAPMSVQYSLRTKIMNFFESRFCSCFRTRNQISKADLERFTKVFRKCAKSDMELTREQFEKMVSSKNVSVGHGLAKTSHIN